MLAYDSLIDEGDEALRAGDVQQARALFLRARRLRPSHPGAVQAMARLEEAQGRPQLALALLSELVAEAPQSAAAWCNVQALLTRIGAHGPAGRVLREALDRFPTHGELLTRMGDALARVEEHREAASHYEAAALTRDEPQRDGLWRSAEQLLLAGRTDAALSRAMDAVALTPLAPGAHVVLARAQAAVGELALGRRVLATARARLPANGLLERTAGALALEAGELTTALTAAITATRLTPDDWLAWELVARIHLTRGAADSAEKAARRAVSLGGHPDAWVTLAAALRALGRPKEARATLRSLVDSHPFAWRGWQALGELLVDEAPVDLDAAATAFDEARCVCPQPERWRPLAWLALVLTLEGRLADARRAEAHARAEAPRHDPILDRLARRDPSAVEGDHARAGAGPGNEDDRPGPVG